MQYHSIFYIFHLYNHVTFANVFKNGVSVPKLRCFSVLRPIKVKVTLSFFLQICRGLCVGLDQQTIQTAS